MKRYSIVQTDDERGEFVRYSDHEKEIVRIKSDNSGLEILCITCRYSKACSPHNNYKIESVKCRNYKKRNSQ